MVTFSLYSALIIPLKMDKNWIIQKYSNIPENKVTFTNQSLLLEVRKSASPLFFKLDHETLVSNILVEGNVDKLIRLKDPSKQGAKGQDDYVLRFGLVVSGKKKLSFMQKIIAPEWIKTLYRSFASYPGIGYVHFYNITQNSKQLGKSRVHPATKLIRETFVGLIQKPGPFHFSYKLPQKLKVIGLWIGADGDDTDSKFNVLIKKIKLN